MNVLHRVDPTTRIVALVLLTTPLLLTIDIVSASLSVAWTLLLSPLCGVGWGRLLRRGWPLLLLGPMSGVGMALYGRQGGELLWSWWLIRVSDNSVALGLAITVRVLAVALPAVVLTAELNPTRLGDGLSQLWRLPSRFVIASVAGVRLVSLFRQDFDALRRARRARGMGDAPAAWQLLQLAFGLLVLALRRGVKLATAMEARGFGAQRRADGSPIVRTWGRPARWGWRDAMLLAACVAIVACCLGVAVATGHFRLLGVVGNGV